MPGKFTRNLGIRPHPHPISNITFPGINSLPITCAQTSPTTRKFSTVGAPALIIRVRGGKGTTYSRISWYSSKYGTSCLESFPEVGREACWCRVLRDTFSNRLRRPAMSNLPCTSTLRHESGLFQHRPMDPVYDDAYNTVTVAYQPLKAKNKFPLGPLNS